MTIECQGGSVVQCWRSLKNLDNRQSVKCGHVRVMNKRAVAFSEEPRSGLGCTLRKYIFILPGITSLIEVNLFPTALFQGF